MLYNYYLDKIDIATVLRINTRRLLCAYSEFSEFLWQACSLLGKTDSKQLGVSTPQAAYILPDHIHFLTISIL